MNADGNGAVQLAPSFGGNVATVTASPRIAPAPATLEEARTAPGRREKIEALTQRIESEGVKYVFFQQVSITGRVMGKGVVASFFPQVAETRLPARLRRHREPLHRPLRRLHRLRARGVRARGGRRPRHLRRAAVGPARRARVLRLLRHRDRRAARRRPAAEPQADRARVRAGARLPVPDRHRARDDVAQEARAGAGARGRHQALLLPHPPVRGAPSGAHGRDRVRAGARPRHELRRPRGRPRPARAELPLRPAGPHGRQHHHLPPGVRRRRAQARPAADLHAQAVHGRLGQRPPPPLHADRRRGQQRLPRPRRAGAALADRAQLPRRHARALPGADVRRQPDGQLLLPHVGHRLLGADLQELGLAEPHHDGARGRRRALRVPRRGLLLQPLPDRRHAPARRPGRRAPRDRPGAAAAGQHLRPAPGGRRRSRRCPTRSAPRSWPWRPTT